MWRRGPAHTALVFSIVFSVLGCYRDRCYEADLNDSTDQEWAEILKKMNGEDYHEAVVCRIGGYDVVMPAHANGEHLWVERNDEWLVSASEGHFSLWREGRILASISDFDEDGNTDMFSYNFHDTETGFEATASDTNMDGQLDFKHFLPRDGEKRASQVWVEGRWHDIVHREGKGGVLIDGVFKGIKEIRDERLSPKTTDGRE